MEPIRNLGETTVLGFRMEESDNRLGCIAKLDILSFGVTCGRRLLYLADGHERKKFSAKMASNVP
jgi:hypothetical protein